MSRWRLVAGVGVVAVLALTLIVLSVQGGSSSPPTTTTLSAASTSADSSTSLLPTTTEATTVTTTAEQRLAEVEELLRELWFGWFDAIYRKDPDALWEVVATTQSHDAAVAAMETMNFTSAPSHENMLVRNITILLDRPDCLVVEHSVDMSLFRGIEGDTTVRVLWPHDERGFRFATAWKYANDLWFEDCNNLAREETP